MNNISIAKIDRLCKWCMVYESTLDYLKNEDISKYCAHEGGHEWIEEYEIG